MCWDAQTLAEEQKGRPIAHFLAGMLVLGRKLPAPSTELSARLIGQLECQSLWRGWNIKSPEPNYLGPSLPFS